jgi:hypothetical protein
MSEDRRKIPDRRSRPTRPFSKYFLIGRRSQARREEEKRNFFVDSYGSHYFILIVLILLLCVLDAYFTLRIIRFGGSELNPLMISALNTKPTLVMVIKYLLTAVGIIIILIFKNFYFFGKIRIAYFIYVVFFIYIILVAYEAYFVFAKIPSGGVIFP